MSESEELAIEVEPDKDDYPFVESQEQKLRCFIFESMNSPDVDGGIMVSNLDMVFQWITNGKVAAKPKLKVAGS